jgi:hypothetical protein
MTVPNRLPMQTSLPWIRLGAQPVPFSSRAQWGTRNVSCKVKKDDEPVTDFRSGHSQAMMITAR